MEGKRRRGLSAFAVVILTALCLTACGKYVSSYKAIGFVHSNVSDSGFMSFFKFEGTMAFKLKLPEGEANLKAVCRLEEGKLDLYCDDGSGKKPWIVLEDGDELTADWRFDASADRTVYVLVETEGGPCANGDLQFSLE